MDSVCVLWGERGLRVFRPYIISFYAWLYQDFCSKNFMRVCPTRQSLLSRVYNNHRVASTSCFVYAHRRPVGCWCGPWRCAPGRRPSGSWASLPRQASSTVLTAQLHWRWWVKTFRGCVVGPKSGIWTEIWSCLYSFDSSQISLAINTIHLYLIESNIIDKSFWNGWF